MSAPDYAKPLPALDDANAAFWAAAKRDAVAVQRCSGCGVHRFPAARLCAACRGEECDWVTVSGRGRIESFCVFHQVYFPGFADDVPYNVVHVRLEEGAQLFSNLVGIANEDIKIGMAVEACFEAVTAEVTLVKFRPARPA